MITYQEVETASKKLYEEEFFNRNFMSVGITQIKNNYEIIVYLHKKINTSNLPLEYDGVRIEYKFAGDIRIY